MNSVLENPLTSLLVTLGAFYIFGLLQKKANGHSALNPVVWAIIACVVFIKFSGISYESYMNGAGLIHFLLGPVTVALAVPLYRLIDSIRKDLRAILITIIAACLVSAFSAYAVMALMDASREMSLAITSKSVTAPIAIGIADKIGTPESLAILFVFSTNIPWLLLSGFIFKIIHMQDERAQGLALGVTCHGLGVARAFQVSKTCGTYSVMGMSLMGIISGILLPTLILLLLI